MNVIEHIHEDIVCGPRVRALASAVAELIPHHATVVDIGCGDGLVSQRIQAERPDISIEGIDVLLRGTTHIPVTLFDGRHLPHADNAVDVTLFIDVLHHTTDPTILLREASRVAKHCVIVKDHTRDGWLAGPTLRFMDRAGNARHGVALPYNYWTEQRWRDTFRELALDVSHWRKDLALYPWWASWLFGRSLHFIARLVKRGA